MKAIIVADGPSAKGFIPPAGVKVFAVKGAIDWLPRADYWFSLDPNERSMRMMQNRRAGVENYCACDRRDRIPDGVHRMVRVSQRGVQPSVHGTPEWWLWRWQAVRGLCRVSGHIHTGNSAWGALGLAYHKGFRDVLLVGVDADSAPRHSDGKQPRNLSHLPLLFRSALPQVRLYTVGHMVGIKTTTVEEWLACP